MENTWAWEEMADFCGFKKDQLQVEICGHDEFYGELCQ